MLYAGVSWNSAGYEVEVVDQTGRVARTPVRFAAGERDGIVAYLRRLSQAPEQSLVAVVDSTNGVLDGSLMAAGLEVYGEIAPPAPGEDWRADIVGFARNVRAG
ncbi:hypothetical protein AB0K48_30015, partial [Nonomuraea sp. NPDC055795]